MRALSLSALALLALPVAGAAPALAGTPQDVVNFTDVLYAGSLGEVTGLSWGARGGNNYLFVCNKAGDIRVIRNGTLQPGVLDVRVTPILVGSELGLLNVMTDIDFGGSNPYVYIFVTETSSVQRVHRYTFSESAGTVSLSGKTVVGPVFQTAGQNHNGGGLTMDSNGLIYVGVGNNNNGLNNGGWQQTDEFTTLASKVSRMDRAGNPRGAPAYLNTGDGIQLRDYIWARGFRNPFGLRIRPNSGNQLWMFEVGDYWEQIFHVTEDSNQGWVDNGAVENNENNTSTTNGRLVVKYAYRTGGSMGRCLTRGTFYNGSSFPSSYQGDVFFLEHNDNRIYHGNMSGDSIASVATFVTGAGNPTDIAVGPDGALYYTARSSGEVRRLYYNGSSPTTITTQPQNQTVTEGQSATFNVTASGNTLTYQWQWNNGGTWTSIAGATSASYNTGATTVAMNGRQYRVVVTGTGGTVNSNPATLTVNYAAPTITVQPQNQTVTAPTAATFSVTATGTGVTYQWQLSTDGGTNWTNIAGATASSYNTGATTTGMSGYRYRVVVDNPASGNVISNAAILTVNSATSPPSISTQPANQTVTAPAAATFTVSATGTGLTYQWERSNPGSATWTPIAGATQSSYTTPATSVAADNGARYRVVVLGTAGPPVTSTAATLTVLGPPAATPVINPAGGSFSGPVTVRITTATAGATIRYTMDNSAPTGTSPAYVGPFTVSTNNTVVRAIATAPSLSNSAEASATFMITGNTPYGLPYRDDLAGVTVPPTTTGLPTTLSGTGLFSNLANLTPGTGMVPFNVNAPLWSDGAAKMRWVGLPAGAKVTFSATGDWVFPDGSVLVKHFALGTRRLETRVFRIGSPLTNSYGVTYKWRLDNSDADLLTNTTASQDESVPSPGGGNQTWSFPGRDQCLGCHTQAAGVVLGPKTRQLNGNFAYPGGSTDNQLRTWNYLQMFSVAVSEGAIAGYDRMVAVDDAGAALETRVRSYLDSNCSNCHRPGPGNNSGRATWNGLWTAPISALLNAPVQADTLGLTNPLIVAPGEPNRSMLLHRITFRGPNQMPVMGSNVVDPDAVATITAWINSMPVVTPPTVTGLTLNDATTNAVLFPLTSGMDIDLATLPAGGVTIVAAANAETQSVRFAWAGNPNYRVENNPPYSISGDNAGDLAPWPDFPTAPGTGFSVMATPYSMDAAAGTAGSAVTITFNVIDSGSGGGGTTPPPTTPPPTTPPPSTTPPPPAPTGPPAPSRTFAQQVADFCGCGVAAEAPPPAAAGVLGALAALALALLGRRRAKA